jgi:hypothetical protein
MEVLQERKSIYITVLYKVIVTREKRASSSIHGFFRIS